MSDIQQQVEQMLQSEESSNWLQDIGLMHRELSDREVRIGLPAREPQRSIYGVELTEEQFQIYLKGWTLECLKLPLSNAQELGRLGGLVKSEAKSTTARENGKKGGRPSKQLDIEDI